MGGLYSLPRGWGVPMYNWKNLQFEKLKMTMYNWKK